MTYPIYHLTRPFLFLLRPEFAHSATFASIQTLTKSPGFRRLTRKLFSYEHPMLVTQLWNQSFPNPIGLAAGLDKDARLYNSFFDLGFGFVEVGTVTPEPQKGNPKPRIFRLPQDQAIINRLGFNNRGMNAMTKRIQKHYPEGILGINIGKNQWTDEKNTIRDYELVMNQVYDLASYITINISSPNTENLRTWQNPEPLRLLLESLFVQRQRHLMQGKREVPLVVKIAPDFTVEELTSLIDVLRLFEPDAIIATNTTVQYKKHLTVHKHQYQTGGLSGKPLRDLSTEVIRRVYQQTQGKIPIIGVGGIFSGQDAYDKIRAGASLVQIYTSLVYQGASTPKKIKQELVSLLQRDGFSSVGQAVGIDCQ